LLRVGGEVRDGTHTPERNSLTVAEAAEIWLQRGENERLERATMRSYVLYARAHIVPLLGEVRLSQLTTPRVAAYRDELLRTRSRYVAQRALTLLKMLIREMERRGLVAHNAASPVRLATKSREKKRLVIGRDVPTKEEVLPNNRGGVMRICNLDQKVYRALQISCGIVNDAGGAKYGLHKLRHFFASWAIEQQFPAKRLQEILGHSSITMTYDRYGHWFPAPQDDQARMTAGERAVFGTLL